ncbi:MAG TPA: hypothetical protein PKC43_07450 [Phycisphaerales bacterium]|nr:hypothetical protein [Phycisphaerales bacterium]HMP37270.1 hypothetical protein [Phycisphaerales bacterium]
MSCRHLPALAAAALVAVGTGTLFTTPAYADHDPPPARGGPGFASIIDLGLRPDHVVLDRRVHEGGIASTSACAEPSLTQSNNTDLIQASVSIACLGGGVSGGTGLARSFVVPPDGFTVGCVRFGVAVNQGGDWPVFVRIFTGGAITGPYDALTLLGETSLVIPDGGGDALYTAEFPGAVALPGGSFMIIEIWCPSRIVAAGGDAGLIFIAKNSAGQSAPSYIRAPECGPVNFVSLASAGFPNSHLIMTVFSAEEVGECPADLNGDGTVDGADLGLLLSSWGGTGSADLNNDGVVDGADLGLLLSGWGACP